MKSWIVLNIANGIWAGFHLKCALDEMEINASIALLWAHTYLLDAPTEGPEDPRILLYSIITGDSTNKYFRAAFYLCESPLQETWE